MKSVRSLLVLCLSAVSLLGQTVPQLPEVAPEPASGQPIADRYLNRDGEFYLHMSTAQWAERLEELVGKIHALVREAADENDRADVDLAFHLPSAFLRESGVRDLGGVGASSVVFADGMYHNRLFLQHPKDGGKGFLWEGFVAENRPFELLELLPATTAYARWGVVRPEPVWGWVKRTIQTCGRPDDIREFEEDLAEAEAEGGYDLDELLKSYTGGVGVVVTLDPSQPVWFAAPSGKAAEFPNVAGAMLFEMRDDKQFDLIAKQIEKENGTLAEEKKTKRVDRDGVRAYVAPQADTDDSGLVVRLTVASFGRYLVFSSSDELVFALASRKGGLAATPGFQRWSEHLPKKGFGFSYRDPRLGNAFHKFILTSLPDTVPGASQMLEMGFSRFRDSSAMSVAVSTPDGVVFVANQSSPMVQSLLNSGFGVHIPVLSGMLLPALAQAREKARRISENGNFAQIGKALILYADAHGGNFPDDLGVLLEEGLIKSGKVFVSPSAKTRPPETAADLRNGQCDCLYFGKGRTRANCGTGDPILCTKPNVHIRFVNVLYGDGHVKGIDGPIPPDVQKLVDAVMK